MSQQPVTKCDACSKIKGDLNRWVKYSWSENILTIGSGELDCCSEACMKTMVARAMSAARDVDHETVATLKEYGSVEVIESRCSIDTRGLR